MKGTLPFLFSLLYLTAFSQTKQVTNLKVPLLGNSDSMLSDSADIYIAKLTCNSVIVTTTYFEQLLLDSIGQRLVSLIDENLDNKLLSHFNDTRKVLAIHVILTKKLEPDKNNFRVQYIYDKDYKQIERVNYSYNNFNWYYLVVDNNPDCFFHIDKDQVERQKLYWAKRINPNLLLPCMFAYTSKIILRFVHSHPVNILVVQQTQKFANIPADEQSFSFCSFINFI